MSKMTDTINMLIEEYNKDLVKIYTFIGDDDKDITITAHIENIIFILQLAKLGIISHSGVSHVITNLDDKINKQKSQLEKIDVNNNTHLVFMNNYIKRLEECKNIFKIIIFK